MNSISSLDLVEELRLRRWARLNYVPLESRASDWHPVILNEMALRDSEDQLVASTMPMIVPLRETRQLRMDGPHTLGTRGHATRSPQAVPPEYHYS